MTMFRRLITRTALIALSVALVCPAPGTAASSREASIGGTGELYVVREGIYGELFPEPGLPESGNRALALDVTYNDRTRERFLVPGTDTDDIEDSASMLFEDHSGTLFVLWQTTKNGIHTRLNLIGFRSGEWTEAVEISGSPFGWKSAPQLAITRDTFQSEEPDGSLRLWQRTVAHLIWWETGADGSPVVLYSPVVLLDGVYTGWNPVYRLDELLPETLDASPAAPMNLALAQVPKIESGGHAQSVSLGFIDSATHQLITVELELLPGEITFIADRIRAHIDDLGRDLLPDQPGVLGARVRAHIDDLGNRLGLHPGLRSYLAKEAEGAVLASDPDEPVNILADRIRAHIDDLGARVTDRGFGRIAAKDSVMVVDLPTNDAEVTAPGNQMRLRVTSARPAPATGSENVSLHLSPDGSEVLVSWGEDGVVYYRESRGDDWSSPRTLQLGAELDLARAHEILEQRADERAGE